VPERITEVSLTRVITYPNGDLTQYVVTVFRCRPVAGVAHAADEESLEARYFSLDKLPELCPDHLNRIAHAARGEGVFFRGAAG